jgi:hypothetical protein
VAFARFEYLVTAFAAALCLMFTAWLVAAIYPLAGDADTASRMAAIGIIVLLLVVLAALILVAAGRKAEQPPNAADETEAPGPPPKPEPRSWRSAWRTLAPGLLLFAVLAIPVFAILVSPSFSYAPVDPAFGYAIDLWRAAAAGAVGAFFSISLAIRSRTVLPDLLRTSNMMDAVLRLTIGFIAGAVVMALIRAGFVDLHFGDDIRSTEGVLGVLIVGFIAGFSERLVPDLLEKANFKPSEPGAAPVLPAVPVVPPARGAATATDRAPGAPPAPPAPPPAGDEPDPLPEEAAEDACVAEIALNDDEATADSDLPAAAGGVQRPAEGGPQ